MKPLTARERAVAELVAQARSNKTIARQLGVVEGTVKVHLCNIFRKLAITSRIALAVKIARGKLT